MSWARLQVEEGIGRHGPLFSRLRHVETGCPEGFLFVDQRDGQAGDTFPAHQAGKFSRDFGDYLLNTSIQIKSYSMQG